MTVDGKPVEISSAPLRPLPGTTFDMPTSSPTLQSAAKNLSALLSDLSRRTNGDGQWTGLDADEALPLILRHFSFVDELVRERDEARAERDRTINSNAKLRAIMETGAADLSTARARMRWENMDAAAKIEALAEAQYEADRTPDVEPSWKEITRKDPRSYVRHTFLTRARAVLRVIEGES